MDVNKHDRLFNIRFRHTNVHSSIGTAPWLLFCISQS